MRFFGRVDGNVGMRGLCGQKDAGDAVARKREMGKTKEEIFGRGEGGNSGGRSEGRGSVRQTFMENPLQNM